MKILNDVAMGNQQGSSLKMKTFNDYNKRA